MTLFHYFFRHTISSQSGFHELRNILYIYIYIYIQILPGFSSFSFFPVFFFFFFFHPPSQQTIAGEVYARTAKARTRSITLGHHGKYSWVARAHLKVKKWTLSEKAASRAAKSVTRSVEGTQREVGGREGEREFIKSVIRS